MRRTYSKPTVQIENFVMDIEIMADISKVQLDIWKEEYVAMGGDPNDQAAFDQFLLEFCGYDNSTSGFCYFTPVQPS